MVLLLFQRLKKSHRATVINDGQTSQPHTTAQAHLPPEKEAQTSHVGQLPDCQPGHGLIQALRYSQAKSLDS